MKFVVERFGALPRGKTMGPKMQSQLPAMFKGTPIYDEAIRRPRLKKLTLERLRR
jgi:hypothetical protein